MIPKVDFPNIDFTEQEQPGKTYRMRLESERVIGSCDGLEAVKQAVYKILSTERYRYPIYSWNYGVELEALIGRPANFVCPEAQRRITEALLQDSRIQAVDTFSFRVEKGKIGVTFIVHSIYGSFTGEREVEY